MLDVIARSEEHVRLSVLAAQAPGICWDRLLFSAKESIYKAWFPLAKCWLGFESADIVFDARGAGWLVRGFC
jgi:4'-phosphopantetheinyl transferase EntD